MADGTPHFNAMILYPGPLRLYVKRMSAIFSQMAQKLVGSEVLKIAGEINALIAESKPIINFTVGDFDPKYFPIPVQLRNFIVEAYEQGFTNYPPSSGMAPLRSAVADFYNREFKTKVQPSQVLVAGGARPLIYTIFTALVDPGDEVLFPVPSWNNNHYTHLTKGKAVALACKKENGFMPTLAELAPHLKTARLLCLNSPLNPTGTCIDAGELTRICQSIVSENKARASRGERALYLMYDQIYWQLSFDSKKPHPMPQLLIPEVEPYTLFVDGISKYFCSTGLRVGWSIIPEKLFGPHSSILGHIGAWAPKPEQLATAKFLNESAAVLDYVAGVKNKALERLRPLFDGIMNLKAKGLAVDAISPEGGIYLSLRIMPTAKYATNEAMRRALLFDAGIAVVPFQAFGLSEDSGWFRMSIGAVAKDDIPRALQKLENFLVQNKS
jgi:aspartate aminotransferase